ncbi:hypothetical protein [Enterocloster citroniae]|uniref:hypothetical protein n=1 Tax=Enterocloster citroniae TaxID=358743 RepID=UPI00349EBFBD
MRKKLISLCLALCLTAGGLWGCSAPAGTGETGASRAAKNAGAGRDENIPKGRYAESTISIPLEEGEIIADMVQTQDKILELYTLKDGTARRYRWAGGNWEREEKSLLEGVEIPFGILHVVYGQDGYRYAVFPKGDDYKFHLLKLAEGKEPQELLEDVFSVKHERGFYEVRPDFVAVAEDGSIFLSGSRETNVYSPQGERLVSLPQEWSSSEWKESGLLLDHLYITNGSNGYLVYDITTGSASPKEEIPYQSSVYDQFLPIAHDGGGGIFTVNSQGIHHMNPGGSIWETVADGTLNSLSLPSAYARKLFVGAENDFYVWLQQSDKSEIKHYTYDPEMPSVPCQNLTVYGLNLESTDTIRQAASMFQLTHPDVRVELIDGQTDSGGTTDSDTIRSLNTELLGGNGADILVLDGLPVQSYMEKGVLEDMKDLLAPMTASGELMGQIAGPYTEDSGSIYQIPTRMILLAAYGDQEAIDSLASLESMREYQSDPSHLPLRTKTKYENLTRQILSLCYEEIVDSETGRPRPGKIQELLETVKVLGDACGARADFDESEDGGRGRIYNRSIGADGLMDSEYDSVDRGRSAIAIDKIRGMFDTLLPLAVQRNHGFKMENLKDSYLPSGVVGINSASPRKDLAKEFVLYVLSVEVQSSDLADGLPVNALAAEAWVEREDSSSAMVSVSGGEDGYTIAGAWPTKEERRMIFDAASRANKPVRTDRVLTEIIIDETKGYFEGSLSLEQAAQNAQNKANLYFSE